MKVEVVIHPQWGAFNLSEKAQARLAELRGDRVFMFEGATFLADENGDNTWKQPMDMVERHDPLLIEVVRELGDEAGPYLKIVTVHIDIEINAHDGFESVSVHGYAV